jgi:hypothetical protein
MNPTLASNRLVIGLTAFAAIAALVVMLTSGITDVWLAPIHTFLTWAFVREVDPDHDWTALTAGFIAGLWVIAGQQVMSALALLGVMVAARLVLNSTGRRPLLTDLIFLAVMASAIAFTPEGWIAGFGLALAIYVDERFIGPVGPRALIAATLAALGVSAVATWTEAIPQTLPDIRPLFAFIVGVIALVAIVREPVAPLSITDSRDRRLLEARRLHATRSLVGVVLFLAALLMGPDSLGLLPAISGFVLALAAGERVRMARRAG